MQDWIETLNFEFLTGEFRCIAIWITTDQPYYQLKFSHYQEIYRNTFFAQDGYRTTLP